MILAIIVSAAALSIQSCKEGTVYPFDEKPPIPEKPVYFPNTVGSEWTYIAKSYGGFIWDTIKVKITRKVDLPNNDSSTIWETRYLNVFQYFSQERFLIDSVHRTDDTIWSFDKSTTNLMEKSLILPLQEGMNWECTPIRFPWLERPLRIYVRQKELIKVPKDNYEAYRLELVDTLYRYDILQIAYYVPYIGIVKWQFTEKQAEMFQTIEMTDFKLK